MAKTLKLDDSNDLDLVNGNFVIIEGTAAIDQNIKTRLQTFLGEWFLNTLIGVAWSQAIFRKPFDALVSGAILKRVILGTKGVTKINKFDIAADLAIHSGQLTYTVTTEENVVIENIEGVIL